jgi:hypothetical protein
MRRWFLSYNSQDLGLMQSLEEALRRKDAEATIFFAPKSLRAGGLWLRNTPVFDGSRLSTNTIQIQSVDG